jgi:hypothetical protein
MYSLGGLILLLWLWNILLAAKKLEQSVPARRIMFSLALVVTVLSIFRSVNLYGSTVVFANIIVLGCILIAFIRSERKIDPET